MWFLMNNIDSHSIECAIYNVYKHRILRLRSVDWKSSLTVNKKLSFNTALFWWERWACALHWLSSFTTFKCYCPLDTSQRAEVVLNNVVPYMCLSYTNVFPE